MLLAIGGAFWLGVLTSVSPCPMATNIAAIGYLARNSHSRLAQLAAGLLYAIGRAVAYTLVGALIAWGCYPRRCCRISCKNTSAS